MAYEELLEGSGQDHMSNLYTKYDATMVALKSGSAGDVLTGNGTGNDPTWETPYSSPVLFIAPINIGDWNMNSDATVNVPHGLTGSNWKKIRGIEIIIRNDADTAYYKLERTAAAANIAGGVQEVNSTNVVLARGTGLFFDDANFNSTSYNRGFVTISMIP